MLSEITRKEIMDILGEGYMTQTFFYLGSLDEIGFFSSDFFERIETQHNICSHSVFIRNVQFCHPGTVVAYFGWHAFAVF